MPDRKKARLERAIFRQFSGAGRLRIDASSIESREPPEPDIYCTVDGKPLAFELVQVVDPNLARMFNDNGELVATIKQVAKEHSAWTELQARLGDALVWVRFSAGTERQRKQSIPGLLKFLAELPPGASGEFRLGAPHQSPHVQFVQISRPSEAGPHFQVIDTPAIADQLLESLRVKWSKHYQTSHEIHLLAYYHWNPSGMAKLMTISDAEKFIRDNWSISRFTRVWVFEVSEAQILLDLSRPSKP